MSSSFLASLPNTEGISFFSDEIMYACTFARRARYTQSTSKSKSISTRSSISIHIHIKIHIHISNSKCSIRLTPEFYYPKSD